MNNAEDRIFEIYKLFVATAEKVSDRRANANTWMLTVNGAIVGLYGYLGETKASVDEWQKSLWLLAIPAAGVLICLAWASLLESYRRLNSAKFKVILDLETTLPGAAFTRESEHLKETAHVSLSLRERRIPIVFAVFYLVLLSFQLIALVRS